MVFINSPGHGCELHALESVSVPPGTQVVPALGHVRVLLCVPPSHDLVQDDHSDQSFHPTAATTNQIKFRKLI